MFIPLPWSLYSSSITMISTSCFIALWSCGLVSMPPSLLGMCAAMTVYFRHRTPQNRHMLSSVTNWWRKWLCHGISVTFVLPWRNEDFRHRCAFVLWRNDNRQRIAFVLWRSCFVSERAQFSSLSVVRQGAWCRLPCWQLTWHESWHGQWCGRSRCLFSGPRVVFLLGHVAICDWSTCLVVV